MKSPLKITTFQSFQVTVGQEMARPLTLLGYAFTLMEKNQEAFSYLDEALRYSSQTKWIIPSVELLPLASLLCVRRNQFELAIELHALGTQYLYIANSSWFKNVVKPYINQAEKALTSEAIAAAQARGRERDLTSTIQELQASQFA